MPTTLPSASGHGQIRESVEIYVALRLALGRARLRAADILGGAGNL
jgi:hypothetical protein